MKKWLIASGICLIPIILLGICNPIGYLMAKSPDNKINQTVFMWYVGILSVCIAVVATTIIGMLRYTSRINKLDKWEENLKLEEGELRRLIRHYNTLITNKKQEQ